MDRARNPESMTTEERLDEVASILSCALVRMVRLARTRTSSCSDRGPTQDGTSLDTAEDSRLSVAPRPGGEGAGL